MVVRIDHISLAAVSCTRKTAGIAGLSAGLKCRWRVHRLESRRPAILRQIVVVHTDSGANDQVFNPVGRVCDSQAWSESLTVILGHTGRQRQFQSADGCNGRVIQLAHTGRLQQAKGGVPAQTIVDGQPRGDAPDVHGIEPQPLYILRKAPVSGWR